MQRDGWTLLFRECLVDQLRKFESAVARVQHKAPMGFAFNANLKQFDSTTCAVVCKQWVSERPTPVAERPRRRK